MKVGNAIPGILDRLYPIVKADYSLLTVLYLLRMRDMEAVPISPMTPRSARALFGFSSLPGLLERTPEDFERYVAGPCQAASMELPVLRTDDAFDDLLAAFDARKLGVAAVHDGKRANLVTLTDVLELYKSGVLRSRLRVRDVASKIEAMPGGTTIRDAIRAMFSGGHRRVFLRGRKTYVSDRSIIRRLLSPMVLEGFAAGAAELLSSPVDRLEQSRPTTVSQEAKIEDAAKLLLKSRGGCLTTARGTLVTPWDVVVKPWSAGALDWGKTGGRR